MPNYSEVDSVVQNLNRKITKLEPTEIVKFETEKGDAHKNENLYQDYPMLNKYNLEQLNKKQETKKLPKDAKELKNLDLKPSVHRLPNPENKKSKPNDFSELNEPSTRLEHKDIDVLKKIQQIKDLLEMSKQEPQTPQDLELLKKTEIAKKKYLKTLGDMQQRLKDIEYKYFTLPQILNRTITSNFSRPSKDMSINVNESKINKKKFKVEENLVPKSSIGGGKQRPKLAKEVKYSDAFFPKREAIVPPLLFPKSNFTTSPENATKVKLNLTPSTKEKPEARREIKPQKSNIDPDYNPNRERIKREKLSFPLKPKLEAKKIEDDTVNSDVIFSKVTQNIEMLFNKLPKESEYTQPPPKHSPRSDSFGIELKKFYTPPTFIQKIKHPELFANVPAPTHDNQSTPSLEKVSEKQITQQNNELTIMKSPQQSISRRIPLKPTMRVETKKPPESIRPIKKPADLVMDFIKQKDQIKDILYATKANKVLKNIKPVRKHLVPNQI